MWALGPWRHFFWHRSFSNREGLKCFNPPGRPKTFRDYHRAEYAGFGLYRCGTFYLRSYFSPAQFCFSADACITTNCLASKARPSGLVLCFAFWPQSRGIELTAT